MSVIAPDNWLTQQGVMRALECSRQTVSNLVAQGKLAYRSTPLGRLYDPEIVAQLGRERAADTVTVRNRGGGRRRSLSYLERAAEKRKPGGEKGVGSAEGVPGGV